jgi:antirestriction protein ArdC
MKVYEIITNKIIEKLEQGVIPWQKPWRGTGLPKNFITKKLYRGINIFLLHMQGYGSPYWLTFKQVKELKGCVRQGEKGTLIVYWNWHKVVIQQMEEEIEKLAPFLRYYKVFNVEQCEGLKIAIPENKNNFNPIAECEKVVRQMPNPPIIKQGKREAYYLPTEDIINIPRPALFKNEQEYYCALYHEIIHSTGHQKRLNRKGAAELNGFGSKEYSKEELIAEIGASYLCAYTGIENKTIDSSAAYIKGWLEKLDNDKRLIIIAAAKAQRAVDYVLNRKETQNV